MSTWQPIPAKNMDLAPLDRELVEIVIRGRIESGIYDYHFYVPDNLSGEPIDPQECERYRRVPKKTVGELVDF